MSTTKNTARNLNGHWIKSSRSNANQNCVEVRFDGDVVLIRDSKYLRDPANDPADQPIIAVPLAVWPEFLSAAVDRAACESAGIPQINRRGDGVTIHNGRDFLEFSRSEWEAFVGGIGVGEFAAA
ncbi:DUF397 domain-containing protein [Nocardia cyriacigeorgica]|uniref:DUF397 domain-containing protein n=1 Tax=Nocardia cyriacigeorgica TaxID=135487 RepID=UPI00189547A2|nr:DUF397 domain-containing protein [Nocardia cyriacigeorgica]MBF6086213.1 DUF397 domain-containing protein [Nocardia cyriacigeorgica]MBF6092304.1 DUF397 domain-containing protein [Nocardia cyriacigeorgica]MBF6396897.1 DUF397 domain-containing protein [Nocardia cyriacigeorgica]MBF6403445.1 DUF397 domain-containing protein [Nocardia cyriacigeorgica]